MTDAIVEEIKGTDVFDTLVDAAERTVKEDRRMIEFLLATYFSAYTNDPNNLGIEAPTSEGKTYPAVEVAKLFPKEDVWLLGGLSPTSLVHERGQLVDRDGNPIDIETELLLAKEIKNKKEREAALKQIKEKLVGAHTVVDLDSKILLFLEDPSLETWERLRPILSHDAHEISYKFTDKTGKGQLRSTHVKIRGWPAAIYLRAGRGEEAGIWDQIQSRFATISPSMSAKKYRAAIKFAAMQKGLPAPIFERGAKLSDQEKAKRIIRAIRARLLEIKREANRPGANVFWVPFWEEIGEGFPADIGRHMRDSKRFLTIMQMSAAINVLNRPILEIDGVESIVVTRRDYERAIRLFFEEGGEEVLSGIPGHVIRFFKDVVLPLWGNKSTGLTTDEMVDRYKTTFTKTKSAKTILKHYLPKLEDAGLLTKEPDPDDKRRYLWRVLRHEVIPENWRKLEHFSSAPNFTLETFKEKLNALIQIGAQNWRIYDNSGTELTPDQVWEKWYSTQNDAPIQQKEQIGAFPAEGDKNRSISEKLQNAPNFLCRFTADVPEIVCIDGKTYGPFKIGDVAKLPQENAELMVKRGVAKAVGVGG